MGIEYYYHCKTCDKLYCIGKQWKAPCVLPILDKIHKKHDTEVFDEYTYFENDTLYEKYSETETWVFDDPEVSKKFDYNTFHLDENSRKYKKLEAYFNFRLYGIKAESPSLKKIKAIIHRIGKLLNPFQLERELNDCRGKLDASLDRNKFLLSELGRAEITLKYLQDPEYRDEQ